MSRAAFRSFPFFALWSKFIAHSLCLLSYLTMPSLKHFISFPYLTQENLYFSWSCMKLGSCSTGRKMSYCRTGPCQVLSQGLFLHPVIYRLLSESGKDWSYSILEGWGGLPKCGWLQSTSHCTEQELGPGNLGSRVSSPNNGNSV